MLTAWEWTGPGAFRRSSSLEVRPSGRPLAASTCRTRLQMGKGACRFSFSLSPSYPTRRPSCGNGVLDVCAQTPH